MNSTKTLNRTDIQIQPFSGSTEPRVIGLLVAMVGIAVSLALWMAVRQSDDRGVQAEFGNRADRVARQIAKSFRAPISRVESLNAFWMASQDVTRAEFHSYSERLFAASSGIGSVDGHELQLIRVSATEELPEEGRSLVMVALIGTAVHVRIFDASGQVIDKPEFELFDGEELAELKSVLNADHLPLAAELSPAEKKEIINNIILSATCIQALEFIPRVAHVDRERYESEARAEGMEGFQFFECDEAGDSRRRRADADVYFPVYFAEPQRGNMKALGFDLASEATRREALRGSTITGREFASAPIGLVQWGNPLQKGFLLAYPVNNSNRSVEGFAVAVVRPEFMIRTSLATDAEDLEVIVYDATLSGDEECIYWSSSGAGGISVPAFSTVEDDPDYVKLPNSLAGRKWIVAVRPLPEFIDGQRSSVASWAVLMGGFALTASVAVLAMNREQVLTRMSKWNADLERRVHERTDALRNSEERLQMAVAGARAGVWHWDIQANEVEWCSRCAKILGIAEAEAVTYESFLKALHPDDRRSTDRAVHEALEARSDYSVEYRVIWPDRSIHWVEAMGRCQYDDSGNPTVMRGILMDITPRKSGEEALRAARDEAQAANRAKSDFLANMSHEIRTPMNGVLGMTELLLQSELNRQQREFAEMAYQSGENLLNLLNDILDFSKIEAGKMELGRDLFSLGDSIGGILQVMGAQAEKKGLELTFHISPEIPDRLIGDVNRLRQVLFNLLGNAIKFTEHGEVVLTVEPTQPVGEQAVVRFSVRDTGIGISEMERRHIFDAFSQADTSTSRRFGGTGLGLTIARSIVNLMKGELTMESTPRKGSAFSFTLALEVAEADDNVGARIPDLRDARVLVVDDNESSRKFLMKMLADWGMVPEGECGGAEALVALKRAGERGDPFRFVLVDQLMPEMEGEELARRIQADDGLAQPHLLLLATVREGRPATGAVFAAQLTKPVSRSGLLNTMLECCGTSLQDTHVAGHSLERMESGHALEVLLAEDNRVNQHIVVGFLEQRGHHVTVAANGRIALEFHASQHFDLLLMDVQMPEMNGFEATAEIRRLEAAAGGHIPIIAMTAHAMKGDRDKCLAVGMDSYIAKPVHSAQLFDTIASTLKRFGTGSLPDEAPDPGPGFDEAAFREHVGQPSMMREIIGYFPEDAAELLDAVERAIAGKDRDALHQACHTLKGLIGNFKAPGALRIAERLEACARAGEFESSANLLPSLRRMVAQLDMHLRSFAEALEP